MVKRLMVLLVLINLSFSISADQNDELILASAFGQTESVISFIEQGADVNAVDAGGNTAVRVAIDGGHDELVGVLFDAGAEIYSILNESSVRIRNQPNTHSSMTIGSLEKGDQVVILGKSRSEEIIQSMSAYWYKVRTEGGIIGYSYGYFFDVDSRDLKALPTFYFNSAHGFGLTFPATWDDWVSEEKMINYGFGVAPVPCVYFGLPDQTDIFVVCVYTPEQWEQLSNIEPPDGVTGDPIARNNQYLIDYSVGHYAANDEMHKRRGDVQHIMKTIEVEEN